MSRAIEILTPDFVPSPLQRAAIERIEEYKAELKRYGMYVRSSMELEFMVKDKDGLPVANVIHLKKMDEYLRDKEQLAFLRASECEGHWDRDMKKPHMTPQYEMNISDDGAAFLGRPQEFCPEGVATVTERLKQHSLKKILRDTTCLTSAGRCYLAGSQYVPSFAAWPFEQHPRLAEHFKNDTSALHTNVSLYDEKGQNLFYSSPALADHCAHSLAHLQKKALLPMLPNDNSLKRIDANKSAPAAIGIIYSKFFANRRDTSVAMRDKNDPTHARLENRLPGADADPFVTMALTMASLVDVVRKHAREGDDTSAILSRIDPLTASHGSSKGDIPKTHAELVERYTSPSNAKELIPLLGKTFYDAILSEYKDAGTVSL